MALNFASYNLKQLALLSPHAIESLRDKTLGSASCAINAGGKCVNTSQETTF
jgi:hypothetical protein